MTEEDLRTNLSKVVEFESVQLCAPLQEALVAFARADEAANALKFKQNVHLAGKLFGVFNEPTWKLVLKFSVRQSSAFTVVLLRSVLISSLAVHRPLGPASMCGLVFHQERSLLPVRDARR